VDNFVDEWPEGMPQPLYLRHFLNLPKKHTAIKQHKNNEML